MSKPSITRNNHRVDQLTHMNAFGGYKMDIGFTRPQKDVRYHEKRMYGEENTHKLSTKPKRALANADNLARFATSTS